jgi:hypothetical protein
VSKQVHKDQDKPSIVGTNILTCAVSYLAGVECPFHFASFHSSCFGCVVVAVVAVYIAVVVVVAAVAACSLENE